LAPGRYGVQFTLDEAGYATLCAVQALLGHAVPLGDVAVVVSRALACYRAQLERRKFARTEHPRPCRRSEAPRHIPAAVRREVWARDGGRCTFVSGDGHRCASRTRLEYDHVEPVAAGGRSTVANLRLRCRAHNQQAAEQRYRRDFMDTQRQRGGKPPLPEHVAELIPWLRTLGFRTEEVRGWAECCMEMAGASLEERLRHALRCSARARPGRVA
jgi:5-methylcytosine-specific restriction endonuclease McrA